MENIFIFVEEISKKLNRPIKDLDDIRIAMAALKEIREQQIPIDFQVGPIEVTGKGTSVSVFHFELWDDIPVDCSGPQLAIFLSRDPGQLTVSE